MSGTSFVKADFAVFQSETFSERMALLRQRVKPKLITLSQDLATPLSAILGETLYPHVAQHLRRTVNPPLETWAAFAKERRAYKPYVHLRTAINLENVRVTIFVEDYADEKAEFANRLMRRAEEFATLFQNNPQILAYDIRDAQNAPLCGASLTPETLQAFGERMLRVKGQHAVFGIPFPKAAVTAMSAKKLETAILEAATTLAPLYRAE